MALLDLALTLVDRLIQLAETRQKRDEKIFKELIHSLFKDIEVIHADYLRFLESTLESLQNGTALSDVRDRLKMDRLENESMRRRVTTVLREINSQDKFNNIREFTREAEGYFYCMSPSGRGSISLIYLSIIDTLSTSDYPYAHQHAVMLMHDYLEVLRGRWDSLSKAYATLLMASI